MTKTQNNLVTEDYLDKRLEKLKGDIVDLKDEIVGEIKATREEFDVHQSSHARINDTLEDHEKRLSTIEKP